MFMDMDEHIIKDAEYDLLKSNSERLEWLLTEEGSEWLYWKLENGLKPTIAGIDMERGKKIFKPTSKT